MFWLPGLNRYSNMATPCPASALPQGILTKADMQLGIQAMLQWDPELKEKAAFELENTRECLLFSRAFFAEDKARSVSLTKGILFFTILQNALNYPEVELEDVGWKADSYNNKGLIQSLQEKVKECPALYSKAMLEKKMGEVESAAKFIGFAAGSMTKQNPQKATLLGAWVCLDDLYVHLEFRFAKMDWWCEICGKHLRRAGSRCERSKKGRVAQSCACKCLGHLACSATNKCQSRRFLFKRASWALNCVLHSLMQGRL